MRPEPITVTYLNRYIKDKLAGDEYLQYVYVKGEISNFKHHYTGHLYFTLKDEQSLIKCVMFKSSTATLNFVPEDGMKVLILGTVSVFEKNGVYQIYVKSMEEDGVGDLYDRYEKLKRKLEEEGLFDKKYKKPIPFMPKIIGVLTSKTGSVIQDIINVSTRRNPNVYIKLFPIPVQGTGAEIKIVEAIRIMNEQKLADVLILARGGGSIEDLWPFNEEITAKAIFDSKIPIISAVGHETDFTISDFVADLRAPTPSAAAELAVANIEDINNKINSYQERYRNALKRKVEYIKLRYEKCISSEVFKNPKARIRDLYIELDNNIKLLENNMGNKINELKTRSIEVISRLDALSPLKTLTRGYVIAERDKKPIKRAKEVNKNDILNLKFIDGNVGTKVI